MNRSPALARCSALILAGLVLGCAAERVPPAPVAFEDEIPTLDGLRRLDTDTAAFVFVRPEARIADFTELIVDPFMLSYTSPRGAPERAVRMLDSKTEARFTTVVRDAFVKSMRRSRGFSLVEEPGPQALRVQGWLLDLVLIEPPTDDRRNSPLCFAEVTVMLTVRHAQTAQPLARVAERHALACRGDANVRYQTTSWKAVGRGVRTWADFLRRWLEDLRELTPIEE